MEEENKLTVDDSKVIEEKADNEQENMYMIVPSRFQLFFNKLRELTIDKIIDLGQRFSEWNNLRKQDASSKIDEIKIRSGEMDGGAERLVNQLKANLSLEEQSENARKIKQKMVNNEARTETPKDQVKEAEAKETPEIHDDHEVK
jgi:hypothetical protein